MLNSGYMPGSLRTLWAITIPSQPCRARHTWRARRSNPYTRNLRSGPRSDLLEGFRSRPISALPEPVYRPYGLCGSRHTYNPGSAPRSLCRSDLHIPCTRTLLRGGTIGYLDRLSVASRGLVPALSRSGGGRLPAVTRISSYPYEACRSPQIPLAHALALLASFRPVKRYPR